MTPPAAAVPGAVAPDERIEVLDSLRGFALAGILMVNVLGFGRLAAAPPEVFGALPVGDRIVQVAVLLLVESKFFTLFSLLFGLGLALQTTRARGASVLPRLVRRLAALLLFGVLHVVLLWEGDILVLYAVLGGVLLLLFRDTSDRTVLRWAVVLLAVPLAVALIALAGVAVARGLPARPRRWLRRTRHCRTCSPPSGRPVPRPSGGARTSIWSGTGSRPTR